MLLRKEYPMKKNYQSYRICLMVMQLLIMASCNGQALLTTSPNDTIPKHTTIKDLPKLIRTQGVAHGSVSCELQDKSGNLWFSIDGEGAYRYDGKTFTNFTTKDGMCSNNVGPIIQDKNGDILFGTKKGICKYDGKSFSQYPITDTLSITCMLEDKSGNLWFGTWTSGIYCYDGKKLTNFLNNDGHSFNLGSHNQFILDILQDKKGNIWFSSWNGGGVWRYDGKSFKNFIPAPDYYKSNEDQRSPTTASEKPLTNYLSKTTSYSPQSTITDDMIFSMAEDKNGNIWFATRRHGACRFDGKDFTSFREKEGLISNGVNSILQDYKGNIWFTTEKNGVFCYDGKIFKNYTTADGLLNNPIVSILQEKNGNIWFGTKWFGLSRYDGKSFTNFSGTEYQ